jgi:hypothetical protein
VRLFGNGTTYSPTAEHAGSARLLREVEDQPAKAVAEQSNVQVDEESDVMARKLEIREELCRVDRRMLFHHFEFDDDTPLHEEVEAQPRR